MDTLLAALTVDIPAWYRQAACRDADPETFFPDKGAPKAPAVRICGDCPVRAPCRDYALATGQQHGIWGGLSSQDRRRDTAAVA